VLQQAASGLVRFLPNPRSGASDHPLVTRCPRVWLCRRRARFTCLSIGAPRWSGPAPVWARLVVPVCGHQAESPVHGQRRAGHVRRPRRREEGDQASDFAPERTSPSLQVLIAFEDTPGSPDVRLRAVVRRVARWGARSDLHIARVAELGKAPDQRGDGRTVTSGARRRVFLMPVCDPGRTEGGCVMRPSKGDQPRPSPRSAQSLHRMPIGDPHRESRSQRCRLVC
jgi:hypothetical protein